MLTWLADLAHHFGPLNLFRYISFRTAGATATALLFVFFFGPSMIAALRLKQGKGQPIRIDGPPSHLLTKAGVPTMGGFMILSGVLVAVILWADLTNPYVWITLFVTLAFGLVGFYDDYLKVTKQTHKGLQAKTRLGLEMAIAGLACFGMMQVGQQGIVTQFSVPLMKGFLFDLGVFFLFFGALVIVASGNAVNLTDGLDGLAIVPVMIAVGTFGVIAWLVGNEFFARYLGLNYVRQTAELAIICGAILGAGLGFLWFNAPPAQIFMGDTGSLALGAALGTIAVAIKHEVVWFVVGGLFVVETLSVIVQVASFKLTGKRMFKMAPLHHHFEQLGWSEPQIVVRFWIIAFVLAMLGLATLKVR